MPGVIYIACTNVGRSIIKSHLKYHSEIKILGIINLNFEIAEKKANYDSLYDISIENNLDIFYCNNVNDKDTIAFIKSKEPTLVIQSGWSQKFGKELLSIPKYGCIGEHPSPIPVGRGAACVNWALIEGQKKWGDTFFQMVDEYDAGKVYAQEFFDIEEENTCFEIYNIIAYTSYLIIKNNLKEWCKGKFNEIKLDESKATYYKKRKPEDGLIDLNWEPDKVLKYINALTKPYPGAFIKYNNERIIIWKAKKTDIKLEKKIGTFLIKDKKLYLVLKNNSLLELQLLESKTIPLLDGYHFYKLLSKKILKDD